MLARREVVDVAESELSYRRELPCMVGASEPVHSSFGQESLLCVSFKNFNIKNWRTAGVIFLT